MHFSIDDYLGTVVPHVAPELVSPENMSHIRQIMSLLPGPLTSLFGFECRLGANETQTDFALAVTRKPGVLRGRGLREEREILAARCSEAALPETFWAQPVWQRLRDFCTAWLDPSSVLGESVTNTTLEFDVTGPPPPVPVPSVYFRSDDVGPDDSDHAPRHLWITRTALPMLTGRTIPPPVEQRVMDCIRRLPAGGRIIQVGAMVARGASFVRMCPKGMGAEQIVSYLTDIGWEGRADRLSVLVHDLMGMVDRVCLGLDVGDVVAPKVGLECYYVPKRAPSEELRWYAFLDYLVEAGLCTSAKRAALPQYPGYAHEDSHREQWPEPLLTISRLQSSKYLSTIARGLHHIKIVFEDARPVQAKAYLSIDHLWLSRAEVRQALAASGGGFPP